MATIRHCFLPIQKGTKDFCEVLDYSGLSVYTVKHDLQQYGWIHTHPTHNCFMSSVDMHTTQIYQNQKPCSIAIVCALEESVIKSYRMTPDGMDLIANCKDETLFHPHKDKYGIEVEHEQIYEEVETFYDEDLIPEIIDEV